MKIGCIFCAWEAEGQLASSLQPWLAARAAKLGGHEFVICAVSVPFKGFEQPAQRDGTIPRLSLHKMNGDIDHMIGSREPLTEVEARGRALQWLVAEGVDATWQVDSDEIYEAKQIEAILRFVESRPAITWFRLCLRNAVFDPYTFLVEPFTPPRIHRVLASSYKAAGFCDDNNVVYNGTITRDRKQDGQFASMKVPKTIASIRHLSWLNDSRSKAKISYQLARGWPSCSFAWDDSKGGLVWNEAHFARLGQAIPEVERD